VATEPAIFAMDEREHAVVDDADVPSELELGVRRAAVLCPEEAITINERKLATQPRKEDHHGCT
jgi:ferredoxin